MASTIQRPAGAFSMPKKRPEKRKDYLSWLHTLPCCITGQYGVEAAHTSSPQPYFGHYGRGKGTKASDIFALPLSADMHRQSHGTNETRWWAEKGVNPYELGLVLWAIYSQYEEHEATERATARIISGIPR
jgi:hypothetical protein